MMLLGFLSALLALWAFIGIEFGEFRGSTVRYDLLNFFSSIGLVAYALSIGAWPFVLTNCVWFLVSLFDLLKISRRRRVRRQI